MDFSIMGRALELTTLLLCVEHVLIDHLCMFNCLIYMSVHWVNFHRRGFIWGMITRVGIPHMLISCIS